jgi:hypothetical protein
MLSSLWRGFTGFTGFRGRADGGAEHGPREQHMERVGLPVDGLNLIGENETFSSIQMMQLP